MKVNIGRLYILEFGDSQTGKRNRLGNFHSDIVLLVVKLTNTKSTIVIWNLNNFSACFEFHFINIYKSIFYFETKPRQPNPTVYPSNSTPPPPQKKKKNKSTVLFHSSTESQVKCVGQPMLWILLLVLRKGFPPWPTRTIISITWQD